MIIAPYDGSYAPAAITLPVVIEGNVTGRSAVMGLFVDLLAARTVLAMSVVDDLGLTLFGEGQVSGSDGQLVEAPTYFATVWVGDRAYWTCALGYGDASYVGRDILDQLHITLDGSNRQLTASVSLTD
jgi:hypothetical protein